MFTEKLSEKKWLIVWLVGFILTYILFFPVKGDPFSQYPPIYFYLLLTLIVGWSCYLFSRRFLARKSITSLSILVIVAAIAFPLLQLAYNGRRYFITNAAYYNHPVVLKYLLNYSDKNEVQAAFYYAIQGDNMNIARDLMLNNVINVSDDYKTKALLAACKNEDVEFIKLLLEQGANPEETDSSGRNCLMLIKEKGSKNDSLYRWIEAKETNNGQ